MKLLLVLILSFPVFADTFTSSDKKTTVTAYGVWVHTCTKLSDRVAYTIHDNQTDKGQIGACALTYGYSQCKGSEITSQGDCLTEWKSITKNKVLFLSKSNREFCFQKGKDRAKELSKKGFSCSETGIN